MFEWIIAAIVLAIFYYKVIAPFSKRMLEIKVEEEPEEKQRIYFDESELEDLHDRTAELKKKLNKELDMLSDADTEERVRHEVLIEKLREHIESNPDESSAVITNINK